MKGILLKYEGYLVKIAHVSDTTRTMNWLGLLHFIWQSKHCLYTYLKQVCVRVCARTLYTDTHTHMKKKFWRQKIFFRKDTVGSTEAILYDSPTYNITYGSTNCCKI